MTATHKALVVVAGLLLLRAYLLANAVFVDQLDRVDHCVGPLDVDKASVEEWRPLGRQVTQGELASMLGLFVGLTSAERDQLLALYFRQSWPTKKAQLCGRLSGSELGLLRRRVFRPGDAQ